MIITKQYAKRLIRQNKAKEVGTVTQDGKIYMAIDRYDLHRTDHFEV